MYDVYMLLSIKFKFKCMQKCLSASVHTTTAAAVAPLLRQNASPHQTSAAISRSFSTTKQSSKLNILASSRITAVRHKMPQNASRSPSQSPASNGDELCSVAC